MFRVACLCVLICGLVFASASNGDNGASKAGNTNPIDEWTEERVEAMLNAKAGAAEGKSHAEVKAEVAYMNNLYIKHIKEGNCGGIIKMFDPDAMIIEHDGSISSGLEPIQFALEDMQTTGSFNVTSEYVVSAMGKNARFVLQHAKVACFDRDGNFMYDWEDFAIWKRDTTGVLKFYMDIYDKEAVTMSTEG